MFYQEMGSKKVNGLKSGRGPMENRKMYGVRNQGPLILVNVTEDFGAYKIKISFVFV
jgi:hypothetical protein